MFFVVLGCAALLIGVVAVLAARNGRRAEPGRRDDVVQHRVDVMAKQQNPLIGGQRDDWSGRTRRR